MKKILFAISALLLSYSGFAQNVDRLLGSYIEVKNALVHGDSKVASAAIATLQQIINGESTFAQKVDLLKATERIGKVSGIEKQRAAFNDLSTTLWKVVKNGKASGASYYQYCPMKNAYWISKEKEIRNPYYGVSMLTCGSVRETKN